MAGIPMFGRFIPKRSISIMIERTGRLVTVLTVGNPILVALARSILANAKIPCMTQGEGLHHIIAAGPVQIQVFQENAERARKLLKDL